MIQAIKGAKDMLPESSQVWQFLESKFREVSALYGYSEMRTPIFEKTEVFHRSIGEETDIVNKEMYTFTDKGGESITLRPENTAAIVRATIQNSLLQNSPLVKVWYFGPFFRYERPQKGRLRQFHQFGCECMGGAAPECDAENIALAAALLKAIGIDEYKLIINSLGNEESRENYKKLLVDYLNAHIDELSEDSKRRLESNPLRVLDSKEERDKKALEGAPSILDCLDEESKAHFEKVLKILDSIGIKYAITPNLVRGLDYYCHTVYEFQSSALGSQDSLGGGGRYNGLFEQLGAKAAPCVGFAMGVERLILILEALDKLPKPEPACDVYIVNGGENFSHISAELAEKLRRRNLKVSTDLFSRSFKAQFREANRLQAKFVIVLGEDEVANGTLTIKNMSDSSQVSISVSELDSFQF
jgi:histidyl-tRNA synthetase